VPLPLATPQGGFTYVFVIIGALNVLQAVTVLILRAWVNREGGLPDGGTNPRNARVARLAAADAAAAANAAGGAGAKALQAV
jgi:hypothetical protein